MSLATALLALYALLVGVGIVALFLARAGRMRLPLHVVGAVIVVLAALIVAGFAWLLSSALAPG